MIYDLNNYVTHLPTLKRFIQNNPESSTSNLIERIVLMTSMPVIVAASYVGELRGYDEAVNQTIEVAKRFYSCELIPLKKDQLEAK